ncbi:MAG: efflux RND transporter permease subunit [Holophagales bacterium]|nr:efflux RND transporter permease subunit [Holophagales bacterium]
MEDDDSAGVVISNPAVRVSGAPTGIGRDGVLRVFHRWTYTVTLTSKPTSEVTVQIDPGDKIDRASVTLGHRIGSAGDIGNLTQGLTHEVVLQPDKWDDGATIQVTVIAPADHEGMATLKHKTISEDPSYSDREWETLPVAWGS